MRIHAFLTFLGGVFFFFFSFDFWARFWGLLGSLGSPSWTQLGFIRASVGPLGGFLGVLGGLLGALGSLVGPIWASVGWLCALLKPCDANLGISWVTLSPLGSDLASFGYVVCESSFLLYLWMPLVEFVGIGEAGLDLCQCVSFGGELHTKPNAHMCATYLYMCTCWCIFWHVRLLQQTSENY